MGRKRSEGNNRRPGKEIIVFSWSSEKVTTSTSRNLIHMLKQKETLEERTLMGAYSTGKAERKDWRHHNSEKLSHREGNDFLSLPQTGNHKERLLKL